MDPERMKQAYQRLEALDERLSYKIRPKSKGYTQPTTEQVSSHLNEVAAYTLELKEVVRDLMMAFASRRG